MLGPHIYHIEIQDRVDEALFNTTSPLQITVAKVGATSTLMTASADQSGLIGLLRHLHQQGYVLLSVRRETIDDHFQSEQL